MNLIFTDKEKFPPVQNIKTIIKEQVKITIIN